MRKTKQKRKAQKKRKTAIIDKQAILKAMGISHFDKDIRLMRHKELASYFAAERSGRIILAIVIRNIIWQAYERIRDGNEPVIEGNIVAFWYRWVKPVLANIKDAEDTKTDPYQVMISEFKEMVQDRRLFNYADFDLTDDNWETRRIGTTRPEVLVFTEKTGWIRLLRELHEEFGVSILASRGHPSALTSEYTARHISAVLAAKTPVKLIGIVDYSHCGNIMAHAFQQQLAAAGLTNTTLTLVIHPRHYTKAELKLFKFPLSTGEKAKIARWLKKTGGISRKAYGLQSESMPRARLKALIQKLIVGGKKK